MWDPVNNRFTPSGFSLGDLWLVGVELDVKTTTENTAFDVVLDLGVGDASTYTIPFVVGQNVKTASTIRVAFERFLTIRDSVTQVNPARIRAKADATGATVLVKSFNVGVIDRG